MPYIHTKTSVPISKEQETALAKGFGRAIELVPGKSESFLMLSFTGDCAMYLGGVQGPLAICEVSVFGPSPKEAYDRLTAELTRLLEEILSIPAPGIYIKYSEHQYWGCGGTNL